MRLDINEIDNVARFMLLHQQYSRNLAAHARKRSCSDTLQ